jgi:hypothetical protein
MNVPTFQQDSGPNQLPSQETPIQEVNDSTSDSYYEEINESSPSNIESSSSQPPPQP